MTETQTGTLVEELAEWARLEPGWCNVFADGRITVRGGDCEIPPQVIPTYSHGEAVYDLSQFWPQACIQAAVQAAIKAHGWTWQVCYGTAESCEGTPHPEWRHGAFVFDANGKATSGVADNPAHAITIAFVKALKQKPGPGGNQ